MFGMGWQELFLVSIDCVVVFWAEQIAGVGEKFGEGDFGI
jgi:Sec-independent protein translocase protein TatA